MGTQDRKRYTIEQTMMLLHDRKWVVVNHDDNMNKAINPNDGEPMRWNPCSERDAQLFCNELREQTGEHWMVEKE